MHFYRSIRIFVSTVLFTFFLILFMPPTVKAQVSKGDKLLGGNLSYTNAFMGDAFFSYGVENFTFLPYFGYFLGDGFMVGLGVGVSYTNFQSETLTGVIINPFVRKFFTIDENKFYFFLEGGVGGILYDHNNYGNTILLGISPGFTYFFSRNWGVDLMFKGITFEGNQNRRNRFEAGVSSISPQIGLNFYF
ncbi:MAG: hypothetical protein JJU28_23860 [Cyclobacteriaceae bacterium]|nr:hypothetical protein [Cyclobacteriaceae bacterium]